MSSWRSYLGGRYSPFTTAPPPRPEVTEADYHYLGPEDIVDPPRHSAAPDSAHYYRQHAVGSRADAEDPRAPDILILKHRGNTYPLHFAAFTIGEGILRVGELRKYAAKQTGAGDPRRVKLLYKGKVLKDDAVACREEGLKQNSELMCVVSDTFVGARSEDDSSSDSADEDEMIRDDRGPRGGDTGPRIDVDGTIIGGAPRKKKHWSKKSKRHEEERPYVPTPNPPAPSASVPPPPKPAPSPQPPQQSNAPRGPNQKLEEIGATFRDKFAPMCEEFMANPPSDTKTKTQEYMKLSESILSMVIFKLDSVETEGDPDARTRRKALVQETQKMLNRLDAVGKPKTDNKKGGR